MSKYRTALPQLAGNLYLTDGGLETTLIFHHGLSLPDFAAFHLLTSPAGTETLRNYFCAYASYFMINCAHPTHFEHLFTDNDKSFTRVRGIRANASCKSHSELNNSAELDMGDPEELGEQYAALKKQLTSLNILGGCCGTDHNHVAKIARACLPLF